VTLQVRELAFTSKLVLLLAFLLSIVLFAIFTASEGQAARGVGVIGVVLICFGTWVPVGSILVHISKRTRVPLLGLLTAAAVFFSALDLNDNHMMRHTSVPGQPLPPEFNASFKNWLNGRKDLHDYSSYPVFIVSAEGGGLRAAYFTSLILASIQDRCPRFAQHTLVISGVSGGSLGAAVFAGLASRSAKNESEQPCALKPDHAGAMAQQADAVLKRDYLSPLLAQALYADLLQRFLPLAVGPFDRARALEYGLEKSWRDVTGGDEFTRPVLDLSKNFAAEATPALFLNTTRVETGDRMVISNLLPLHERFSKLVSLTDIDHTISVPLSTAAFLSARFTYVTPAGFIKMNKGSVEEKQRYVDGGYFENSGAATLYDILAAMEAEPDVSFTPIVIRIGNSVKKKNSAAVQSEQQNPGEAKALIEGNNRDERTQYRRQGLGEALSPVRALLNTREARGDTAIRQLQTAIITIQDGHKPSGFVDFQLYDNGVALPLGWLLSLQAREEMRHQLGDPKVCDLVVDIDNPCSFGAVINFLLPATREGGLAN